VTDLVLEGAAGACPRARALPAVWLPRLRWLAIGWIVVFWRLGYPALLDPDEAHYAELTREMLQSGSWLVPLLDGRPYIDKPVLFHWLQGASVKLLGETEFATRLPSALAALALFAGIRWCGTILMGEEVGEWGAIMFATIPATFALSSIGLFDMVFTAFLFGAVGSLLVAAERRSRRVECVGYALLTLAVMTKGPVALVLVGLFLGGAWAAGGRMRERVSRLRWITGLLAVAAAASPWFVWMALRFGRQFVEGYLLAGNLWYFTQPEVFSTRAVSHTFYVRAFAGAFFPWSVVVVGRGVDLVRRARTGLTIATEERLLWLWTIVVIGFFTIARFKLDHYIFPAAPACCLIAARAWRESADDTRSACPATRMSILLMAGALIVAGSFGSVLFDLNLELPWSATALPIALMVGGIALLTVSAIRGWRVPRTAGIVVAMLLVVYAVVVTIGYPVFERTRATSVIAQDLRENTPSDTAVGLYRLERWRASMRYYLGRPITRIETPDEMRAFLSSPGRVYVVLRRVEYQKLRALHLPVYALSHRRAVIGTIGSGLRRQRWGYLVVATNIPRHRRWVSTSPP
jgi:4-amino-4-deoxy-L-arabinose transferase-like glycosyltransferase